MKKFLFFAITLLLVFLMSCAGQPSSTGESSQNFRHIVVWDFKKGLSEDNKVSLFNGMKTDLEKLTGVIDGIVELRVMRDTFNPGLNGEGQLVLDAIFKSQKDYEAYATHPAHLAIAVHVRDNIVDNRRGGNFFQAAPTKHSNRFRHIVIWEYKAGLDEQAKEFQFNRMKKDLEGLIGVIPGLVEMNVVRDHFNTNGNGQVVLVALFTNRENHLGYGPHPEHQKIAGYVVADIVDNSTRRQANFQEQH